MPATISFDGMEEISEMLTQLEEKASGAAARGLYEGAAVMRDSIAAGVSEIKTAPFRKANDGQRLPSPEEKAIVEAGVVGIAKFDKNGAEVNTSVGFANAGYARAEWMSHGSHPNKPIAQVANAINSGTSFMTKQPFIRKAANSAKARAESAIIQRIESDLDEIIKK